MLKVYRMDVHLILFIFSSMILVIGCIITLLQFKDEEETAKPLVDLAVCILSARENFDLRQAVRDTWLQDFNLIDKSGKRHVVAKFFVGSEACLIHPDYRQDPFSCHSWTPTVPEKELKDLTAFSTVQKHLRLSKERCFALSMSFTVMHDIVLKRVGILELFPFHQNGEDIQVVIYDTVSEEEISRSRFSSSYKGSSHSGFKYKPVEEMVFPKGYQFTLEIQMPSLDTSHFRDKRDLPTLEVKESHHNLVLSHHGFKVVCPNSPVQNHSVIPLMSFMFTVFDESSLKELASSKQTKMVAWEEDKTAESLRLHQEMASHGDVVEVEMTDVYRSLPQKLLLCHQWLSERFHSRFVMKTDDDVFVNASSIIIGLEQMDATSPLWWGNFRHNWQVERHGKWREDKYTSDVYPDFACGSGNVVSFPVHELLTRNHLSLSVFQGEDVSMGIWLSAFSVSYIQDKRWLCDQTCVSGFLTIPQLDADSVHWYSNNSRHCPHPCSSC